MSTENLKNDLFSVQTLERKPGFLDAKQISIDSLHVVYMDTLAGNRRVMAKEFRDSNQFQLNKLVTKRHTLIAITNKEVTCQSRH